MRSTTYRWNRQSADEGSFSAAARKLQRVQSAVSTAMGKLVAIRPAAWAPDEHTLHLALVWRRDGVLGPAHAWVADQLATL